MKERAKQLIRYNEIKSFLERYERLLIPGMLIVGVAADFITFRSLNVNTAFTLLGVYAIIAAATIAFLNIYDENKPKIHSRFLGYLRLASPFIVQFTFGALLSASLIFYWFSGAISVSWPFLVAIAFLMASNDILREHYLKPVVQLSVFYFILFSFFSLVLPFALNSIDAWIYVLSGAIAMVLIFFYLEMLAYFLRFIRWERTRVRILVIIIFILMNLLYFLNIIPPIPLSLREAGVYHNLEHSGGNYILTDEARPLIDRLIPGTTLHIQPGEYIYLYSAIFAPPKLKATIVHEWQWFDESQGRWIKSNRSSFQLTGGREAGYRGYSWKTVLPEGRWRVSIENERGQVLGRVRFKIQHVDEVIETKTILR